MKWLLLFSFLGVGMKSQAQGPWLAVVNKQDAHLQIIDLPNQKTIAQVPMGDLPHEVLASPTGGFFAVTNYGKDHVRSQSSTQRPGHTLTFVRANAPAITKTVDLGDQPCAPHGMDASNDGLRLYVTCEAQQQLLVVDTVNGQIRHRIPTEQAQSHMVAVTRDESLAFTSNFSSGTVTAIDLRSQKIVAQITVGPGTEGLSLDPQDRFVYASSVLAGFVVKIDIKTLKIVRKAATGRSPVRVIPTPDGQYVVVSNSAEGTLQIFAAESMTLLRSIRVGRQPIGLAVPSNDFAFSAPMLENKIVAVNLRTGDIEGEYPTGRKPDGIAYMPAF